MTPIDYNLPTAYRGDNYGPFAFLPLDISGNYINLYGADINVHVKNKKNCATILSWSTDNGSIKIKDLISGGLWSGAQFVLDEVVGCDMQMPPNSYIYDVQIYKSKNTSTYFKGTMSVSGDVTRVVDCDCNYSGGTALDVGDSYCYMVDSFSAYRM
jgi:hypothetical protein